MRVPTPLEVIVASAAVGILVLFMKRPELQTDARSEPSTASAPVFASQTSCRAGNREAIQRSFDDNRFPAPALGRSRSR